MTQQFPDIEPQEPVIVETDLEVRVVEDAVDWEDGDVLTLPEGVEVRILNENDPESRLDVLVKFPAGYVEPEHTHTGAHATMILDGTMHIHGHELGPGDYVYGHEVRHGPMEYPDGCTMFVSFVGGSPSHEDWGAD